jgi:glycerol-3-phosphate dehydrogenase
VIGAKYTTARAVAERVVTLAARKLGTSIRRSQSATTVLPFAGIADHEALAIETARRSGIELDPGLVRHLTSRYAEGAVAIVAIIAERPDTAAGLAPDTPTIAAEVLHALRNEAAVRLSDVVLRRTTGGAAGHPGAAVLRRCAELAAEELNWDEARLELELSLVEGAYRVD